MLYVSSVFLLTNGKCVLIVEASEGIIERPISPKQTLILLSQQAAVGMLYGIISSVQHA